MDTKIIENSAGILELKKYFEKKAAEEKQNPPPRCTYLIRTHEPKKETEFIIRTKPNI